MQAPSPTLSLKSIVTFPSLPSTPGMKFAAINAFSSSSLATIAIYTNNWTVSIFCAVALAIVVYLALHFLPC
jgi:hypothetical protein